MYDASESQLLHAALYEALDITRQDLGNIQLVDWKTGYLEIAAQQGFTQEFLDCFRRVTIHDGCACGRALFYRETVAINDVTTDRRFLPYRNVAERAGFRAVQSSPILSNRGALVGIISTHGDHNPTAQQINRIRTLATRTAEELLRWRALKLKSHRVARYGI